LTVYYFELRQERVFQTIDIHHRPHYLCIIGYKMEKNNTFSPNLTEDGILDGIMRRQAHQLTADAALETNLRDFQQRRDQFAQQQQQRQQQHQQQQASNRGASVPPKIYYSPEPFSATLKTLTRERRGDDDLNNLLSSSFPHTLFVALEEAKYPDALKWSTDGKGFYANQDHPTMVNALLHYFKRESNQSINTSFRCQHRSLDIARCCRMFRH
jgi:hypothetical protein